MVSGKLYMCVPLKNVSSDFFFSLKDYFENWNICAILYQSFKFCLGKEKAKRGLMVLKIRIYREIKIRIIIGSLAD